MALYADKTDNEVQDIDDLILVVSEIPESHLSDASCLKGYADSISFPRSTYEASQIIKLLFNKNIPVTVQGARTGLTGAAVPFGGHIMSMDKMNKVLGLRQNSAGDIFVHAEPGVRLSDLNQVISCGFRTLVDPDDETKEVLARNPDMENYFWPVELLEGSATIGGIAGTNASGVTSYKYGRAAKHIEGVRFIGDSGNDLWISRTSHTAADSKDNALASSVLFTQNDFLDAILGGEGMYGVITELALKLRPKPRFRIGLLALMSSESQLESFIDKCQTAAYKEQKDLVAIMEFLDHRTIEAINALGNQLPGCGPIPDVSSGTQGAVYIELHGDESQALKGLAQRFRDCMQEFGIEGDKIQIARTEAEIQSSRMLRYTASRVSNLLVNLNQQQCPSVTKLFTDMRFEGRFSEVYQDYLRDLNDTHMPAIMYGQVMENHLHVNLFPEDDNQIAIAKRLLAHWAQKLRIQNGKVLGNHGVGKLKTLDSYAEIPEADKEKARKLKAWFDSRCLFNPKNRTPLSEATNSRKDSFTTRHN